MVSCLQRWLPAFISGAVVCLYFPVDRFNALINLRAVRFDVAPQTPFITIGDGLFALERYEVWPRILDITSTRESLNMSMRQGMVV